jgi:hypothetical protein
VALADELRVVEERLWRAAGDRDAYAADVAPTAVHVFPGWGAVGLPDVLVAVEQSQPWRSFSLDDVEAIQLGADAAALVYRTRAERVGAEPYRAAITSVYVRRDGAWRLALHQQTPLPAEPA